MENIIIIGIILFFAGYLYILFKKEYTDGPCSSCVSDDTCVKKK